MSGSSITDNESNNDFYEHDSIRSYLCGQVVSNLSDLYDDSLMSSLLVDSDFQHLLRQKDLRDHLVTYCLETCIGQEATFTPATRHQAMRSPQR